MRLGASPATPFCAAAMDWVVDPRPDRSSKSVVRRLCSSDDALAPASRPDTSGLGIIVCSQQCTWRDTRATLGVAAAAGAQIIVVHLSRSVSPWQELAAGAIDVVQWDDDPGPLLAKLGRLREIEQIIHSPAVAKRIVGNSAPLRQALRELITAARFGSGPVLILGETGTGKELAAQVAHHADPIRAAGQLVVVDCTTIVPGLLGSELFGHERGAFTGAVAARSGACAAANGGSLFLDEVGELPLDLQPEFMRVIQEGAYKHVGGDRWQHSSFRLICATNRDLSSDVREGRFRGDLYYRIASSTVRMPPLRERGEDILALFMHFYRQAAAAAAPVKLDVEVEHAICSRQYPGNLRDLRQLAFRIAARHVGSGAITPGDLPTQDWPAVASSDECDEPTAVRGEILADAVRRAVAEGTTLRQLREEVTQLAVDAALDESGGKVRAAAQRLGVTDRALQLRRAQVRDRGVIR
jgi:transcriptional regulator with GAF, ATPase, and Fis domain